MEMYSRSSKTDTERKYNLVALSAPTLGSNPSSATMMPAKSCFATLYLSFHISKIEMPVIIKTLPRFVVKIKCTDISWHLEWHLTHN